MADTTAEALCRCMDAAATGQAAGDPALHRMRALAEGKWPAGRPPTGRRLTKVFSLFAWKGAYQFTNLPKVLLIFPYLCGITDCPVASLLAMTCKKLATCPHNTWVLPVYCRKTSLHLRTPTRLLHVIASQCAHWRGNPHPRRSTKRKVVLRANSQAVTFLPKVLLFATPFRRVTDCPVAFAPRNDMQGGVSVCVCKGEFLQGSFCDGRCG